MQCPECGSSAKSGAVSGFFPFFADKGQEEEGFWRGLRGHHVFIEGSAQYCSRCRWTDINCSTIVLKRLVRRRVLATNAALPQFEADHLPLCPECGSSQLRRGFLFGGFRFQAQDEPEPTFLQSFFGLFPRVQAKADAVCCLTCDWIGVDCATFVEPARRSGFDRIEQH